VFGYDERRTHTDIRQEKVFRKQALGRRRRREIDLDGKMS
jgi:hypothetical protein